MLTSGLMFSQNCDILISEMKTSSTEIQSGDFLDVTFGIKNNAKGVNCQYHAGSVKVYLFLPHNGLKFSNITFPSGGKGIYFNWVFDHISNALVGLNHSPIADGQGETQVSVRLTATAGLEKEVSRTIGLTIVQNEEGVIFPSNDHSNDNTLAKVMIRKASFNNTPSFLAESKDCGTINISTAGTSNNDVAHYELWRSYDGSNYLMLEKLLIENGSNQFSWEVKDQKDLENNHLYSYKMVKILKDGTSQIVHSAQVLHNCMGMQPDFQVFPNPAADKAFIYLGGSIEKDKVQIDFRNTSGELVKGYSDVSNDNNGLDLTGLPSGMYFVSIRGNDSVSGKKFVKLEH